MQEKSASYFACTQYCEIQSLQVHFLFVRSFNDGKWTRWIRCSTIVDYEGEMNAVWLTVSAPILIMLLPALNALHSLPPLAETVWRACNMTPQEFHQTNEESKIYSCPHEVRILQRKRVRKCFSVSFASNYRCLRRCVTVWRIAQVDLTSIAHDLCRLNLTMGAFGALHSNLQWSSSAGTNMDTLSKRMN